MKALIIMNEKIMKFLGGANRAYSDVHVRIGYVSDIKTYLIFKNNAIIASLSADKVVRFFVSEYDIELINLIGAIDKFNENLEREYFV